MNGDAEQEETTEQFAWDRVGQFFGDMAAVAEQVWKRNLTVWNTVSNNVRKPTYTSDAMAQDAAKAMAVAVDNLDDIWTALTRVPEREQVAAPVPTAFLYFALDEDDAGHALTDPVWIRVAPQDLEALPDEAVIGLYGPGDADRLESSMRAEKQAPKGYVLTPSDVGGVAEGTYSGAVYVTDPGPRVLANLRVVVEKKPK
jgi:hypothetical protein